MSIDNISFISCAVEEKPKENGIGTQALTTTNGNNDEETINNNNNINKNKEQIIKHAASTDNLNKQSDDEQENIIPWRAQLRKTNSRLSLVG